jgi:integrase
MTPEEVDKLIKAARASRQGLCDVFMISLACRHGLRVSELVDLRGSAIDWKRADIAVNGLRNGKDTCLPLEGATYGRSERSTDRQSDEYVVMSER